MQDKVITLQELKDLIEKFNQERDWKQFHNPKSVSMAIAAEAAELMEKFLWCDNKQSYQEVEKNREEIEQELADIIITALSFANSANIDVAVAVKNKLKINGKKYPVEKSKGNFIKWNRL